MWRNQALSVVFPQISDNTDNFIKEKEELAEGLGWC